MVKLIVSTQGMPMVAKIDYIIKIAREHPEGITPKSLASLTSINVNTIKSLLPKIKNIRKKEGLRGYYTLVDEGMHGSIFDWTFHNIILSADILSYSRERIKETNSFGTINFEFEIGSESKKATLRVSTEHPINVSALSVLFALFCELVLKHSSLNLTEKDVSVSSVEFNKDFTNLRLDGLNCITFDSLLSQFKVYQKEFGVRYEHKLKTPISAETIIQLLNPNNSLDFYCRLEAIEKNQEIISKTVRYMGRFSQALLEKLNKTY